MGEISFIRDLAMVMMVAGAAIVVFQRLHQPVLLGYILAGVLIGPHMPIMLVADPRVIEDISNLGVVLLMFTLGLEFSVRKLREVGIGILVVAVAEVAAMLWLGMGVARLFGWNGMDALFIGAVISLSSTMVATRMLDARHQMSQRFAQLVVGLLVAEDVLAIVMLTLLTAVAITGAVHASEALTLVGHLGLFVIVGLILGLLLLPRFVDYVAGFGRDETLLICVLGICFGASLLAAWMGFSVALGAFLAGAIVAESRVVVHVLRLVEPLRDMFAALFFVAIGLKIDPGLLLEHLGPALVLALVVIVGKTALCSLGIFVVGHDARTSLQAGLSMGQIGEFSFVIAALGLALGVVSPFVYPVAVAVSVICMTSSPYLVRSSGALTAGLRRVAPPRLRVLAASYTGWMQHLKPVSQDVAVAAIFRRLLWHITINVLLVITLFMAGAWINQHNWTWFSMLGINREWRHALIWAGALFLSLPLLIAVYRKAEALGMLLAELGISERFAGSYTYAMRQVLARLIPLAALAALAAIVGALGATILPPRGVVFSLLLVSVALAVILWRTLVQVDARLQAALKETLDGGVAASANAAGDGRAAP